MIVNNYSFCIFFVLSYLLRAGGGQHFTTNFIVDDFTSETGLISKTEPPLFQCIDTELDAYCTATEDSTNLQNPSVLGNMRMTEFDLFIDSNYGNSNLNSTGTCIIEIQRNILSSSVNLTNTGEDSFDISFSTSVNYYSFPSCYLPGTYIYYSIENGITYNYDYYPPNCDEYEGREFNLLQNGGDSIAFSVQIQPSNIPTIIYISAQTSTLNIITLHGTYQVTNDDYNEDTGEYIVPLQYIKDDGGTLDFTRTIQFQIIIGMVDDFTLVPSDQINIQYQFGSIRIITTEEYQYTSYSAISTNIIDYSSVGSSISSENNQSTLSISSQSDEYYSSISSIISTYSSFSFLPTWLFSSSSSSNNSTNDIQILSSSSPSSHLLSFFSFIVAFIVVFVEN